MNVTITVKMTLVLFLLCSGFFHFTFASNRLRLFSAPNISVKVQDKALDECNWTGASFVTLYDEEDAKFTASFTAMFLDYDTHLWLGLRWNPTQITWSDGTPITFSESSVNVTNGEQICEAIDNNTWIGFNCSERKYFMCKKDNYTLIKEEKNWCQALKHCRTLNSDLVSISNITQNKEVIDKGENTSFWIGLLHDEWKWVDKSCSTFREWDPTDSSDSQCTSHNQIKKQLLYRYGCSSEATSFCSKGTVRIKVIEERLTWEQAFDYCKAKHTGLLWIEDQEDQNAVEQWLNVTEVNGPFWIGLRQSRVFGFWIWASDRIVTYSNWRDDTPPELPLSHHCGVINTTGTWSDKNCWVPLPFLCEEEIVFMNE